MQDLPGLLPATVTPDAAPEPVVARPRLRVVPDVPLDFDAAVRTLTPRLVRYAARRLGDAHEAEEVVQEALLRAYKHRAELLTEDDLAAWSTCVTGRLVIDRLRVRGRSTSVADVPEGSRVGRDTADVVVARDEARTALDALDAMPPRQAAVLWAREVEGLAYDEIGARFGMTEPAVRSILTRARKALRKEYAARGGTLPAGGLAAIAPWADGLGWLERLRGAMGRLTAPAALGVATTGLLAGGLLTVPSITPVTDAPTTVAATVVSTPVTPPTADDLPVLHGAVAATGSAATRGVAPAQQRSDSTASTGNRVIGKAQPVCATPDDEITVTPPAGVIAPATVMLPAPIEPDLGIGDSECLDGEDKSRWEITSPAGDPAGLGLTGVEFWSPESCPDAAHAPELAAAVSTQPAVQCKDYPEDQS